jgi:RNA-directed DNA polymerase
MKRTNDLFRHIPTLENLYLAFWKASKGKRYAQSVLEFQDKLDKNLLSIQKDLLEGSVKVGNYHYFKVYEPKERQICASAFPEQVLHHALMNICHPAFEKHLIFDTYATRKGKGTYAALNRAQCFTHRFGCFLKLDVRKFFETVHHDKLKGQLFALFKEPELLQIFFQLIDSYQASSDRGLPIGNLTSQYFANHYLSDLDHFIKEELKIKAYVRYMDDMVLWHDDKQVLKHAFLEIRDFVETQLLCTLKPNLINYCSRGLPFLGYQVFPHYLQLSQKSKLRFIKKARFVDEKYHAGEWDEKTCQQHLLPLLAFINHADVKTFRNNVFSQQ